MPKKTPIELRFWSKVDMMSDYGCWPWTGAVNPRSGKPMVNVKTADIPLARRPTFAPAYQVAWILWHVRPVPKDHIVYRTCGNMLCCQPLHLRCGRRSDASYRQVCSDRMLRRQDGPALGQASAEWLRREAEASRTKSGRMPYGWFTGMARRLQISRGTIVDAVRGKTWKKGRNRDRGGEARAGVERVAETDQG